MPDLYPDHLKVKDALELYFSKYHFPGGGYHLKWFRIKMGSIYLSFPNTKARIAAVKLHDIHHLVTGYQATLKGEAEISGWEIASGCGKYYMAWLLDGSSFFYGMIFFPRALFKAFMSGRSCQTNLYHNVAYDERLLNQTVGEVRQLTGMDAPRKNTVTDLLFFIAWCVLIVGVAAAFFYGCYYLVISSRFMDHG